MAITINWDGDEDNVPWLDLKRGWSDEGGNSCEHAGDDVVLQKVEAETEEPPDEWCKMIDYRGNGRPPGTKKGVVVRTSGCWDTSCG